jgi:hypothetical protein
MNDNIKTLVYQGHDGNITITLDPEGDKTNAVFVPRDKSNGEFDVELSDLDYKIIEASLGTTKEIIKACKPDDPLSKTDISNIGFGVMIATLLAKVSTAYMGKALAETLKAHAAARN